MRPGPSSGSRIFQIWVPVPVPDSANFEFESRSAGSRGPCPGCRPLCDLAYSKWAYFKPFRKNLSSSEQCRGKKSRLSQFSSKIHYNNEKFIIIIYDFRWKLILIINPKDPVREILKKKSKIRPLDFVQNCRKSCRKSRGVNFIFFLEFLCTEPLSFENKNTNMPILRNVFLKNFEDLFTIN